MVLRTMYVLQDPMPSKKYTRLYCDGSTKSFPRTGFIFTDSEKGRQQFAIKRVVGRNILQTGYCVHPDLLNPQMHPEQGPIWEWIYSNTPEIMEKVGANYKKDGPGILRKIAPEVLNELNQIFEVTGCNEMFDIIEKHSQEKAHALGLEISS